MSERARKEEERRKKSSGGSEKVKKVENLISTSDSNLL